MAEEDLTLSQLRLEFLFQLESLSQLSRGWFQRGCAYYLAEFLAEEELSLFQLEFLSQSLSQG